MRGFGDRNSLRSWALLPNYNLPIQIRRHNAAPDSRDYLLFESLTLRINLLHRLPFAKYLPFKAMPGPRIVPGADLTRHSVRRRVLYAVKRLSDEKEIFTKEDVYTFCKGSEWAHGNEDTDWALSELIEKNQLWIKDDRFVVLRPSDDTFHHQYPSSGRNVSAEAVRDQSVSAFSGNMQPESGEKGRYIASDSFQVRSNGAGWIEIHKQPPKTSEYDWVWNLKIIAQLLESYNKGKWKTKSKFWKETKIEHRIRIFDEAAISYLKEMNNDKVKVLNWEQWTKWLQNIKILPNPDLISP